MAAASGSNMTTDSAGNITLGAPYTRRTPWFVQSDLNAAHSIKTGDHQTLSFEATALNAFNQRAVTAYWGGMDSLNFATALYPGPAGLYSGAALHQELESGYNVQQYLTANGGGAAPVGREQPVRPPLSVPGWP